VVRVGKLSGGKKGFEFFGESVSFDARCLLRTTQSVGLTFPDYENFPAGVSQFSEIAFVPFDVALSFCLPEFFAGFGDDFPVAAFVDVPETAVNEDDFFVLWKDKVGNSGGRVLAFVI
jgi:hypothetical protein